MSQSETSNDKPKDRNSKPVINPNADLETDFGASGQILVTLSESDKLVLIDLGTFSIGDIVDVGKNPQDVIYSPNGKSYYVLMAGSQDIAKPNKSDTISSLSSAALWMWETETHKIRGKSALTTSDVFSMPMGLGIDPAGSRLYICNVAANNLIIRNLQGDQTDLATISVGVGPANVLVTKNDKYVITINRDPNGECEADTVSIIHVLSHDEIHRVEVGDTPWDGCLSADDNSFYVSISGENKVKEISIKDGKILNTYEIGESPRDIELSPDGANIYVASYDDDSVIPFNLETCEASDALPVGKGPTDLMIEPSIQILFVANSAGNSITIYDLAQSKIIKTIKLSSSPTKMAILADAVFLKITDDETGKKLSQKALRDIITPKGKIKVKPRETDTKTKGN